MSTAMEIKDIYGTVIFALEGAKTVLEVVKAAIEAKKSLRDANLSGANLSGAYLSGAKNAELAIAKIAFIPETGSFEAWKKCQGGVIVKLLIPEDAKRSHATERKCRASKAVVLDVFGAEEGISLHDQTVVYRKGETVIPDSFDDNRWNICAPGIHFYITRLEAEAHL